MNTVHGQKIYFVYHVVNFAEVTIKRLRRAVYSEVGSWEMNHRVFRERRIKVEKKKIGDLKRIIEWVTAAKTRRYERQDDLASSLPSIEFEVKMLSEVSAEDPAAGQRFGNACGFSERAVVCVCVCAALAESCRPPLTPSSFIK